MIKVISLGGSIVAPDEVDVEYLRGFSQLVREYLQEDSTRRLIFIVGGGSPARKYQASYRSVASDPQDESQDWIGIAATRLNGELLRGIFSPECPNALITDPSIVNGFEGRILIAAGWKPGFSSDFDAVVLAERVHADTVINLSNIAMVYSADPKQDPDAVPIEKMSWKEFRELVGDDWTPGKNLPFDPVASKRAQERGLQVIVAAGKDLGNLKKILEDRPFHGSTIGPE